ncbi:AI-2E family transporter [Polycladidibacter hongkongensis]|uniref:AI-2E family transporter n=1 Tax=Polycladidibacter hongkongensis TaxID=1647556 RepID=UPI00082F1EBB|nr:AI-2E family transporter [Pseudovibrio hongkongensis]
MTLQRRISFWLISFAVFVAFLFLFRDILLPFVAGMALAYLLDPIADRLEAMGLNRLLSTVTILLLFLILFVAALLVLIPVLSSQLRSLIVELPTYVGSLQTILIEFISPHLDKVGVQGIDLKGNLGDLMGQAAGWAGTLLTSIWNGGQALVSIASLMVVTPVVAFYMLLDWDNMTAKIDSWLPRQQRPTIHRLASEMDAAVAGFVRGQVMMCLVLSIYYAATLLIVGLKFGLLIGIVAGLISFIPYVGALVGFFLSIGVAVVQFWPDPVMIGIVLAIFALGQFLEGNVLQPKLVGKSVGLHPVWLMFALFAFASLLGFVGMLIAIPAAAVVGVLARFALQQYLGSQIYCTGDFDAEDDD